MTITITTLASDDPRIFEAFGSVLNLGQDATPEDVTNALITYMNGTTTDYERRQHLENFQPEDIKGVSRTVKPEPVKK